MQWEATDQFGNLYVGASNAESLADLKLDIASMVEEVFLRCTFEPTFSIDLGFSEISAPIGSQVTHLMNVALVDNLKGHGQTDHQIFDQIQNLVAEAVAEAGRTAQIQGPWT